MERPHLWILLICYRFTVLVSLVFMTNHRRVCLLGIKGNLLHMIKTVLAFMTKMFVFGLVFFFFVVVAIFVVVAFLVVGCITSTGFSDEESESGVFSSIVPWLMWFAVAPSLEALFVVATVFVPFAAARLAFTTSPMLGSAMFRLTTSSLASSDEIPGWIYEWFIWTNTLCLGWFEFLHSFLLSKTVSLKFRFRWRYKICYHQETFSAIKVSKSFGC